MDAETHTTEAEQALIGAESDARRAEDIAKQAQETAETASSQAGQVAFLLFIILLLYFIYYYASPTSGEAYRDRRLTTKFEL